MSSLFGKPINAAKLRRYVGHMEQVAGLRRVILNDGFARGLEAIELRTGGGLEMTVTTGRGLDILNASLRGVPFAWTTPLGPVHPAFAHHRGSDFLKSFSGGLLTTCGLANIGEGCEDQGEALGLHGRYPTLPAHEVGTASRWIGNDYVMSIEGEVREYNLYGTDLRLARRITAYLGENRVLIEDVVQNGSCRPQPHQILYHLNLGYPLLDENAETRVRSERTISRETGVEAKPEDWTRFAAPSARGAQECFFHRPRPDSRGRACVAVVNPKANGGEGLALVTRFSLNTLPWLIQWRCPIAGEYVQGIEPANGWVLGRDKDREAGRLATLKPGEVRTYTVDLEFLSGAKELASIRI